MCKEVLDLVCKMDIRDLELQMALQCAPVITGIKISNLFKIPVYEEQEFYKLLKNSSLSCFLMARHRGSAIYLVYRRADLLARLDELEVRRFLKEEGYEQCTLGYVLRKFHERYEAYMTGEGFSFPHEIGILLGYPIEDILGFIKYQGGNYLYSGYWKVYSNVEKKKEVFQSYDEAKDALVRMVAANVNICSIMKNYENIQHKAVG